MVEFAMATPLKKFHDKHLRATLHGTMKLSVHQSRALVCSAVGAGGQILV